MAMAPVHVAFIWHMHQPWYLWPSSRQAALPFARLHATGAYCDMPWLLKRFDDTRVTFNVVPSLVSQLAGYAAGEITDRAMELSRCDAADLGLNDQRYLLTHMCGGHHHHGSYDMRTRQFHALPRAPGYWAQLSDACESGGNSASIAGGYIYHVNYHQLTAWTGRQEGTP